MLQLNLKRSQEYTSHLILGTPMESIAEAIRHLMVWFRQIRSPELKDIHAESFRMKQVMQRVIHGSINPKATDAVALDAVAANCIDVGCHLGSMMQTMVRLAPQGKHIAVEPVPYKAAWLKRKFPTIEVKQIALSDRAGQAEFFIQTQASAYSGLRFQDRGDVAVKRFTVQCERLDDIVPGDRPIHFIKLDAEGGELNVLRSGTALLNRCHPVVMFTCTQLGTTAFQIDPQDVFEFFQQQGYAVFTMQDWLADRSPLSAEQFKQTMHYPFQAFRFLAVHSRSR